MADLSVGDVFSIGLDGKPRLEDQEFENCTFDNFVVPGSLGEAATISRVRFSRCRVSPGTCMIRSGCQLSQVTFEEFRCGDSMMISSEAELEKVTITGKKYPRMLWIRPQREPFDPDDALAWAETKEWCLDISNYYGEVCITGVSAKNVIVDSSRHVTIEASRVSSLDWRSAGVHPLSYWKLMARKASLDGGLDGIFSLPPEQGRNFERSTKELELLRSKGILV